ncbi:hypothetical protein [Paenibacillus sp. A3]|nr:hypothetical protein [Paenibacillus sp. A3]
MMPHGLGQIYLQKRKDNLPLSEIANVHLPADSAQSSLHKA